eukprot:GHVH01005205.1.p1 GENE.GHVH01005205.1~~GHVH01005205.1.p1  ORF type:complete len:269 (+),score=27.41 GHVH01005205.1:96-902(+)
MVAGSLIVTVNLGAFCTYIQRAIARKSNRTSLRRMERGRSTGGPDRDGVSDPLRGLNIYQLATHSSKILYMNTLDLVFRVLLYYSAWLIIGALGLHWIEGKDLLTCIYWACQMMSGAGMGDVVPDSRNGRLFASAWTLIAIYISLERLTASAVFFQNTIATANEVQILQKAAGRSFSPTHGPTNLSDSIDGLDMEVVHQCDVLRMMRIDSPHKNEGITAAEFAIWLAVESNQLSPDFAVKAMTIFRKLDRNNDGYVCSPTTSPTVCLV